MKRPAAVGPLRMLDVRCCCFAGGGPEPSRGRAACFASVRWSARCAGRLPCGARACGASRNSLRELRSLRSDNRDESDHEARCARRRKPCAPRHRTGAAPAARPRLGSSSARSLWRGAGARQASSLPCSGASRARCPRSALLLKRRMVPLAKPWAGVRWRACAAASSAGLAGSARSAPRDLTRRGCLSAVNAVRAASSATPRKPEQHSAVAAQRRPPHRHATAHPPTALHQPSTRTAVLPTVRNGVVADFRPSLHSIHRGRRHARCSH
jgi:hypothetical protein